MTTINTLFSGGQGGTIPAGAIGQKITWASAPSNQTLTTSTADWTNANIVLTAGVWLVIANINIRILTAASSGSGQNGYVLITDSSNAIVQNQSKSLYNNTSAAVAVETITTLPFSFVSSLSSTTTYKIRSYINTSTGSGTIYNQNSYFSEFFGIRLA